jgi:hypothetical protein
MVTREDKFKNYQKLLSDIRWKSKTYEIKDRDKNKCLNCNQDKHLEVHHRQYHYVASLGRFKHPWDYPNDLLITLCKKCHEQGHRLYRVPIKNI